jgi:hypothetical protein
MVIAVIMAFTFGSAKAQVVVRARIGAPVHHRVYHRRAAVVVVGTGPYYWHGRHYHNRAPYWRNHHRYYRYY